MNTSVRCALRSLTLAPLLGLAVLACGVPAAFAVPAAPRLTIHTLALPTHLSSADNAECLKRPLYGLEHWEDNYEAVPCDSYQVTVTNSGSETAAGPIVLTDTVPAGLELPTIAPGGERELRVALDWAREPRDSVLAGREGETGSGLPLNSQELCKVEGQTVTCELPPEDELKPGYRVEMKLYVLIAPDATPAPNLASVSEAGVTVASSDAEDPVGSGSPGFGPSGLLADITGIDGVADTQAGDHPYELATRIDLNTRMGLGPESVVLEPTAAGEVRDVVVDLPLGLAGDAAATPKCTFGQLQSFPASCPLDTEIGHIATEPYVLATVNEPVYNMVPREGVAAEFGFRDLLFHTHVIAANLVPTARGYVLQAVSRELPDISLTDIIAPFYGDPAHKQAEQRQTQLEKEFKAPARLEEASDPVPMFTNSSDCSGAPLTTRVFLDSWENPGAFNADGTPDLADANWKEASSESPPVTGCGALRFDPTAFTFAPEPAHSGADEPSGYESVLKIPQTESPSVPATPPLKTTVVTLPAGTSISPAAAQGLVGCRETGSEGIEFQSAAAGHCPAASKVGTVEVATPLLEERLSEGDVYVAQPACGGAGQAECTEERAEDGEVFAIYLEVSSKQRGIHLKLRGKIEVGGNGRHSREVGLAPGQVRTSFVETPQMPFSELKLNFNGGPRAPLANPQGCGTFTTNAGLEPWSHTPAPGEAEGTPDAVLYPSFNIAGCENRFAAALTAGTTNSQAGAYTPFTLTISRQDREQDLSGVTVNMPPGLIGKIAGIAQCGEAQANAGTCSAASQIGTATGAAGSGSEPLYQSGPVYLTGPTHLEGPNHPGAPFGLSVVVPANAGPYHLGNIVVRAAISVNPTTAAITVVSNPLPQSIDGVPLRLKTVNVTVGTGNNFTFNPTDCNPMAITGTISSAEGASAAASSPFNATNCTQLVFKPVLSASTAGRATKANGASLDVRVAYPTGSEGTYANIKSVKVDLPKQLPSRLTTLQKACLAKVFEANPANCPPESDVGTATASTPLLNVPVSGPAYLVSHGNEAFPDLEIVLQGEGITLILDGNTLIKKGITSSTFKTIPDAPVSSFELKLPTKKFAILGSNVPEKDHYSLCGQTLSMPTAITAQNGAVIKQTTKIAVTGCPKVKKAKAAKRAKQASKSTRRGK